MWPNGQRDPFQWGEAIIEPLLELSDYSDRNGIVEQVSGYIHERQTKEGVDQDETAWMIPSDLKPLLVDYRGEKDAGRTHSRIHASCQRIMDI
jgi:hypothetical protein